MITEGNGGRRCNAVAHGNRDGVCRNQCVVRADVVAVGVDGGRAVAGHVDALEQLIVLIYIVYRNDDGRRRRGRRRRPLGNVRRGGNDIAAFEKNGLRSLPGNAVYAQAVIILKALHGLFGVLAVDTVYLVGKVAQLLQAALYLLNALAAVANVQGGIGRGRGGGDDGRHKGRRLRHIGRGRRDLIGWDGGNGRRGFRSGGNQHDHVHQQRFD